MNRIKSSQGLKNFWFNCAKNLTIDDIAFDSHGIFRAEFFPRSIVSRWWQITSSDRNSFGSSHVRLVSSSSLFNWESSCENNPIKTSHGRVGGRVEGKLCLTVVAHFDVIYEAFHGYRSVIDQTMRNRRMSWSEMTKSETKRSFLCCAEPREQNVMETYRFHR